MNGTRLSFAYLPFVDINGAVPRENLEQLLREFLDNVDYDGVPSQEAQHKILRQVLFNPKEFSGEYMYLPLQLNSSPKQTKMATLIAKDAPGNYITIVTMICHTFSRGVVHINSADPATKPLYDPRYLSHPLDLEILARQTQYLETIVETEPLKSMLKKDGRRIPAQADAHDLSSAKEIAKERLYTAFHPSSTCAMIPRELGGVVSEKLIVHGTSNLRIVDASVFPIEPLGNIQATVYAVAEKAADLIKHDWFD